MDPKPWYSMILKVIIIGDPAVGKTSLLRRIIDNTFSPKYCSSLGVDFAFKELTVEDTKIKLQIWDTAGQEKYRSLITTYYKLTNGIIIVFDLNDMNSFENIINNWLSHITSYLQEDSTKMLILGNKLDLQPNRSKENDWDQMKIRLESNGKAILRDLSLNEAMRHDQSISDLQYSTIAGNSSCLI
jgi:small GTP-binding protein